MTLARTKAYWQSFFGLTELPESGHFIISHGEKLADYWGMYGFKYKNAFIFSVPQGSVEEVRHRLEPLLASEIWSSDTLQGVFADRCERLIGPAYQGGLEPANFRYSPDANVQLLKPKDSAALLEFKKTCPKLDWEHSGISLEDKNLVGYFLDDQLLTVAKAIHWQEDVINLGVVCHPAYQGKGFAEACLRAVIKAALELDHLVLYQTLLNNKPALRLAEKLGFQRYAETLALRLKELSVQ
jgi:ribosomal protein S18 acetylase RimI-like enzyme